VDRWAKGAKGEKIDLLDYIANEEKVPQPFVDQFRSES
jgi:hypothetical protein